MPRVYQKQNVSIVIFQYQEIIKKNSFKNQRKVLILYEK